MLSQALARAWIAGWGLFAYLALHRSGYPVYFGRYSSEFAVFLGFVGAAAVVLTILGTRKRRLRKGRDRATSLAFLFALTTVMALGTVELLMRALDLFGASMYQEVGRYMQALEAAPHRVYSQRPGLRARFQNVEVDINESGLRERPLRPKARDTARVLLLGDSVTFGWGVPIEATFGRRLEDELHAGLGRKVETINSGVCGYNTFQELAFLEDMSGSIQPDVVVLTYVDNDIDLHPRDMQALRDQWYRPPGSVETLLRHSWLYRMAYHILPHLLRHTAPNRESDGWKNSMSSLAAIGRYVRQRKIPFVVFFFRLTPTETGNSIAEELRTVADREGFWYADELPWFEGTNPRAITNSLVDIHPNPKGHLLIARHMADFIMRHHVIVGDVADLGRAIGTGKQP